VVAVSLSMIVESVHPQTGEKLVQQVPEIPEADLGRLIKEFATEEQIQEKLDGISMSPEAKVLLAKLSSFSIQVGERVFRLGKKILELVLLLAAKFPSTTFALILAALVTALIASIPLLGPILSGFLGPLLVLFALGKGVWEDLKRSDSLLSEAIEEAMQLFAPLNQGAGA
jgi:hypothetical protein